MKFHVNCTVYLITAHLKQQVKHRKQQNICVQSQSLNVMHSAKKIITNMGLHQSSFFYEKQVRSVKKMFKVILFIVCSCK